MTPSTKLSASLLDSGLGTIFTSPVIEFRDGTRPTFPDDAVVGNLICTVTLPTSGYFASAVGNTKAKSGTWSGTVSASGTPTWWRLKNTADTGGSSTTLPRLDGDCGTADEKDIKLSQASYTAVSDTITISTFVLALGDLFQARGQG